MEHNMNSKLLIASLFSELSIANHVGVFMVKNNIMV